MKYVGAHVSIAGGVEKAPLNAAAIGAKAFAMFTKNQKQWESKPLTPESILAFKENCQAHGFQVQHILPHDGYLINLCQPDPDKRRQSWQAFAQEMARCQELGLVSLNFHPGSHLKALAEKEAMRLVAEGVRQAIDQVPDVKAVFENTAGQGTNLGWNFEQLAEMMQAVDRPGRIGVCIDTCHAFAAGYDLASPEGFDQTFAAFDRLIGFRFLSGMHLNDAKGQLGQRLDRHHSMGQGTLGWNLFRRLMQDPRFDHLPLILETIDETLWAEEIATLYSFCQEPAGPN